MKYIKQIGIIFLITFIGEVLKFLIPLPIPSSIYGMVILFILLCIKIVKPSDISDFADALIAIMGLMFIPAGVGIIGSLDSALSMLLAIIFSTIVSTFIVMGVSAKVTEFFIRRGEK